MKNLLSVLFLFVTCTVFGQLQKGNLLIGGSASVAVSKNSTQTASSLITNITNINIAPRLGFFLSDRSALGIEPGYSYLKSSYNYTTLSQKTESTSSLISIMPFYRHYFPLGEKVALFLHSKVGGSFGKNKSTIQLFNPNNGGVTTAHVKSDVTGGQISISPGFVYFVSSKWSIEAMITNLSYQFSKEKPASGASANFYSFNFQHNAFSLGIAWYLTK